MVSFSHLGRCRNEAAFAALAEVSHLWASSGRTRRHRINSAGADEVAPNVTRVTRVNQFSRARELDPR